MAQLDTDCKPVPSGNTKRNRCRNYTFTWNNYTKDDINFLKEYLGTNCEYVFQEETGESGTPHLQGVILFKHPAEWGALKRDLPKCHIEKCNNKKASIAYCCKTDSRTGAVFTNIKKLVIREKIHDPMEGIEFADWQKKILEISLVKIDERKIYWIWSKEGAKGKSTFAKHLCLKYGALCVSGKANDVKYAIACTLEERDVKIIVMDVPRTSLEFVSYQALEEIKNGMFFCGKYESKQVLFNPPHLFVFANAPPAIGYCSIDRWQIIEIA